MFVECVFWLLPWSEVLACSLCLEAEKLSDAADVEDDEEYSDDVDDDVWSYEEEGLNEPS